MVQSSGVRCGQWVVRAWLLVCVEHSNNLLLNEDEDVGLIGYFMP